MPTLAIHTDAAADLAAIKARGDLEDHGVLLAFLQQAKSDPTVLETLAEDWFGEDGSAEYGVKKVVSLHLRRKRIWRVKVLTLKGLAVGYRVLYTFDSERDVFYVLGIPPREIAYDHSHPLIQRVIDLYDRLGLS